MPTIAAIYYIYMKILYVLICGFYKWIYYSVPVFYAYISIFSYPTRTRIHHNKVVFQSLTAQWCILTNICRSHKSKKKCWYGKLLLKFRYSLKDFQTQNESLNIIILILILCKWEYSRKILLYISRINLVCNKFNLKEHDII